MALLLRDNRDDSAGFAVSSPDLALFVNFLDYAVLTMCWRNARFGSDGSNNGHGECALETALLDP